MIDISAKQLVYLFTGCFGKCTALYNGNMSQDFLRIGDRHIRDRNCCGCTLARRDLLYLRNKSAVNIVRDIIQCHGIRRRAGRGVPAALRLNDCLRRFQSVQLVEIPLQQGGAVVLRHSHGGAAAVDAVQLHADIRLRQSQRQRQHQRQGQYPTYNSLLHLSPSLRAQQSPLYPVLCSL